MEVDDILLHRNCTEYLFTVYNNSSIYFPWEIAYNIKCFPLCNLLFMWITYTCMWISYIACINYPGSQTVGVSFHLVYLTFACCWQTIENRLRNGDRNNYHLIEMRPLSFSTQYNSTWRVYSSIVKNIWDQFIIVRYITSQYILLAYTARRKCVAITPPNVTPIFCV